MRWGETLRNQGDTGCAPSWALALEATRTSTLRKGELTRPDRQAGRAHTPAAQLGTAPGTHQQAGRTEGTGRGHILTPKESQRVCQGLRPPQQEGGHGGHPCLCPSVHPEP